MLNHMGEPFDSFVGAQTVCGKTGVFYSWEAGEVTPTRRDDGFDPEARAALGDNPGWLPPNQLRCKPPLLLGI